MTPMQVFFEFAQKWVQGLVSARKIAAYFGAEVPWQERSDAVGPRPVLRDERRPVWSLSQAVSRPSCPSIRTPLPHSPTGSAATCRATGEPTSPRTTAS